MGYVKTALVQWDMGESEIHIHGAALQMHGIYLDCVIMNSTISKVAPMACGLAHKLGATNAMPQLGVVRHPLGQCVCMF